MLKHKYLNINNKEDKMGKIIIANAVKRKPGFLYYVDGKGNVCEAEMSRKGRLKKKANKQIV
jgi:hypothetical protein